MTRNKTSLIYSLPVAYKTKILQVAGVSGIAYGIWYGGIYKDRKNFFAQLGISGTDYLALYPEFVLPDSAKDAFERERNSAIADRGWLKDLGGRSATPYHCRARFSPATWSWCFAAFTGVHEQCG